VNKVKKLIVLFVASLMSIMLLTSTSYGLSVGETTEVWYNDGFSFEGNPQNEGYGLYCVSNGVWFSKYRYSHIPMEVKEHIHIDGAKVYMNDNFVNENRDNFAMAYIATQQESWTSNYQRHIYTLKQMNIYGHFPNWYRGIGGSLFTSGYYTDYSLRDQGYAEYEKAVNAGQISATDKTDKTKLNSKVEVITHNNGEYIKVGPLNWEFNGNLSDIAVYDQDSKVINNALYAKYQGKELISSANASEIVASENNFYILVKADSDVSKITNVKGKVSSTYNSYVADIYTLKHLYYGQNLIATKGSTEIKSVDVNIDFKYDIDLHGSVNIVKMDKDSGEKLKGEVSFELIRKNDKKYVVRADDGKISYTTNANDATNFKTQNGEVKIENLIAGSYIVEEVSVENNYGYVTDKNHIYWSTDGGKTLTLASKKNMVIKTSANGGQIYVYNEKVTGNLGLTKKDIDTGKNLANVQFKLMNEEGTKYIRIDDRDSITGKYVVEKEVTYVDDINKATAVITNESGEIHISNILINKYRIVEVSIGEENKKAGYDDTGDKDYVYWSTDGGKTKTLVAVKDIIVEVTRQSSKDTETAENDKANTVLVYNKRKYIDLSGKVWEDKFGGKTNVFDEILNENDKLLKDIRVNLKDEKGNIVLNRDGEKMTTLTDEKGEYRFTYVLAKELSKYYVEFEYDGLVLTSVKPLATDEQAKSSKANEVVAERKALNEIFAEITNSDEGNKAQDKGFTRDSNGKVTGTVTYQNDTEEYLSYVKAWESDNYSRTITANTKLSENTNPKLDNYDLGKQYENKNYIINSEGRQEIQNINLGLIEREQPHLSISSDIDNVRITINGYEHLYNKASGQYGEREDSGDDMFNVGVKFGSKYITSQYTRAIYPSDVKYTATDAKDSDKLKVYITYKIAVRNTSRSLDAIVNELVNYKDNRLEEVYESYFVDNQGNRKDIEWTNQSKYGQSYNDEKYTAYYTTGLAETKIPAQSIMNVYVTYRVGDATVLNLLNPDGDAVLGNVSEINSYSTFYGIAKEGQEAGQVYAGLEGIKQKDNEISINVTGGSAPGNAIPEKISTYEADTDRAPSIKLTAQGVREIEGTVFEDTAIVKDNERNGDGVYDSSKENTVGGVKVELLKTYIDENNNRVYEIAKLYPPKAEQANNSGKDVTTAEEGVDAVINSTTNKGYYIFKGIEPDNYVIKYTYSNGSTKLYDTTGKEITDKEVNVQTYKSTLIKGDDIFKAFKEQDEKVNENVKLDWYRDDKEDKNRYSDARDDYEQREQIDNELKNITNSTMSNVKYTDMFARTPRFFIDIEHLTLYTASKGDAYTNKVSNIDFGIVERPHQSATLNKEVSNIKLTLANGQVLVNGDPRNNLEYVSYIAPDKNNIANPNGLIKIEADSELIYGSTLEIKYKLTLTNTSENDYRNKDYYYYGTDKSNPIKMTSVSLLDYVDKELVISEDSKEQWKEIPVNVEEILKYGLSISDAERENLLKQHSTVVTTEAMPQGTELEAGKSVSTVITLERILSNSDELSYVNKSEVVTVGKTGGSMLSSTVGSYAKALAANPLAETDENESDEDISETLAVVPPTGENRGLTYAVIAFASLVTLGAGIFVVRKIVKL